MTRKRPASFQEKQKKFGYLFILPFMAGALLFIVIPVILSVFFSFSSFSATETGFSLTLIGLENYKEIFLIDPFFRKDLVSSISLMVVNVPVVTIFAFFVATLLNQKFFGRTFARAVFFLPVIVSSMAIETLAHQDVISSLVSGADKSGGEAAMSLSAAFAGFINQLGLAPAIVSFLLSTVNGITEIVAMSAVPIVIFLSGLQSISPSIYEASTIEGATKWEVFWKISFPMISPLILTSIIYIIVDNFTRYSNVVMNTIHTTNFAKMQFGAGSAMTWVYMGVIALFIGVVYFVVNRLVFYYD